MHVADTGSHVADLSKATIALVSSSGGVPVDNLPEGVYKTIHAGFDPAAMCAVPDRGIPVDAMRYFEKHGKNRQAL